MDYSLLLVGTHLFMWWLGYKFGRRVEKYENNQKK